MKTLACGFLAVICGLAIGPLRADETTRRLQEDLRRRYQYFGEIDGQQSEELTKALKSFQKRKGIAPSGLPDLATTQSLGLPVEGNQPVQLASTLPDVPVLKSDQARDISEVDREFLR